MPYGIHQRGLDFLARNRRDHYSGPVQIFRNRVQIGMDVPAQQAETIAEVETGDIMLESRLVDWIVERTDYVDVTDGGAVVEPAAGDIIVAPFPGGLRYFVVASLGGEVPWRPHGRDFESHRIHARECNETEITGGIPGGGHFGLHFGRHFGQHFGGNF